MSTQMDDLNAAIQNLVADADASSAAVTALIDKINELEIAGDLTDEIAAVQTASASLESSKAAADAALAAPAEPPPAEPPVDGAPA